MSLKDKLLTLKELLEKKETLSKNNQTLVFTNGCFDILHPGHVLYLEEAKKQGNALVVALNTDMSVKKIKGEKRPINTEKNRAIVIAALESVDYVILFEEDTPIKLIQELKPEIYVKGGDYSVETLPEYPIVTGYGGSVKILSFIEGNSSSNIIEKIQKG